MRGGSASVAQFTRSRGLAVSWLLGCWVCWVAGLLDSRSSKFRRFNSSTFNRREPAKPRDPATAHSLFPHVVLQDALRHPTHGQAIGKAAEGTIHRTVLGDAELAGAMIDRHLHDLVALHPNEGRKKAMHARVEADAVDGVALDQLQRTAGVGDVIVGDPVADAVPNPRLHLSRPGVVTIHANADNHIGG